MSDQTCMKKVVPRVKEIREKKQEIIWHEVRVVLEVHQKQSTQ